MSRVAVCRKLSWLAGFVFFALMAGGVAQAKDAVMTIHPGKGVGALSLGDGHAQFEKVFPKAPNGWDRAYTGEATGCPKEFFYWDTKVRDSSDLIAYLTGKQISLITLRGPAFALANGIAPLYWPKGVVTGTTMEQVKKAYPDGKLYVLTGTANDRNYGRNRYYWVVPKAGIAFALVWIPSKKQRLVKTIEIFAPGTDFKPEGCVSPTEKFKALP